jgi:16S rRNA (uracil1498-N3)-methyltransferase
MRLHRFFVDADLTRAEINVLDADLLHQWEKVLRLQSGDHVILCDGKGMESEATLLSLDAKHAKVNVLGAHLVTAEPHQLVILYCSVLKRENFEWVTQKAVEVGVHRIVPIIATRTVKTGLKMDRLRIIAREAAEQSGRGIIPEITEPIELDQALEKAKNQQNIFFHTIIHEQTSKPTNQQTPVGIWIGPEGGWTEEEVDHARKNGFTISSLGKLTLRAETAAIIASYLAIQGLG